MKYVIFTLTEKKKIEFLNKIDKNIITYILIICYINIPLINIISGFRSIS